MQDYIPIKIDINAPIPTITIKQYDHLSRFLHVQIYDNDQKEPMNLVGCVPRMYMSLNNDVIAYFDGAVADGEKGIITFNIPNGATQMAGNYEAEIEIRDPTGNSPIISTRVFTIQVLRSVKNPILLEMTGQFAAFENALNDVGNIESDLANINQRIDKLSVYYTPEMFGAVGDGETNDFAAVQEALSHDNVYLSKVYAVSSTVTLHGNVSGPGVIKAREDFTTEAVDTNNNTFQCPLVQTPNHYRENIFNKKIRINLDANNIAKIAFQVNYSSFCDYNIYAVNCTEYGVYNGGIQGGNNENRFSIKVKCPDDGLHRGGIGVYITTHDSYYDEIVAVNFATGVKCRAPTTINVLHPWIFHPDYFAGSVALDLAGISNSVNINWFYQDTIQYGIKPSEDKPVVANIGNYEINLPDDDEQNNKIYSTVMAANSPKILDLNGKDLIKIGVYNKDVSQVPVPDLFPFSAKSTSRIFVDKANLSIEELFPYADNLPSDCTFYAGHIVLDGENTVNRTVVCTSTERGKMQEIVETVNRGNNVTERGKMQEIVETVNRGNNVYEPVYKYVRYMPFWNDTWSVWKKIAFS